MKRTTVMKWASILVVFGIILPALGGDAVLLEDDFSGTVIDSVKWSVLDTPSAGGTVNVNLTGSGELHVDMDAANANYRMQGVVSKQAFTVPAGHTLIADMYGVNVNAGDSNRTSPMGFLSAVSPAASGFWTPAVPHAGVQEECYQNPDIARSTAGISGVGNNTYSALKHVIVTVDAQQTSIYIEDDFWENLASPTPVYTAATASVFTGPELANGLYVVLGAQWTYTSLGTHYENWQGVKVSIKAHRSTGLFWMQ